MSKYKLMPEEATPEMERAAEKYWNDRKFKALSDDPRTWKGLYAAMRDTAPDVQGEPERFRSLLIECERALCCPDPAQRHVTASKVLRMLAASTAPAVQGEPVGWQYYHNGKWWRWASYPRVYADPQPAEQKPAPDVAGLVEALELMVDTYDNGGWPSASVEIAKRAITAHKKEVNHDNQ